MTTKNWRNPDHKYKPRKPRPKNTPARSGTALASNGVGESELFSIFDTFSSVHSQVKSISATIRQVEEMFDSISSIMNTFNGLGAISQAIDVLPLNKSDSGDEDGSTSSLLANFDADKISQMLQSPLVQSLLSPNKEKGE